MIFLAACQSDALLEKVGESQTVVNSTDSCFINLHIVNNSQKTTRAVETEAASAEENAVYDGILAIFEGTDESTATLRSAVVIDQLINNPGSSASINVTQRLAGIHSYSGHLYVLVLLNTTAAGFRVDGTTLKFNNADVSDQDGDEKITIADIQRLQINSVGSTDKHVGLFMSNTAADLYKEITSTYLFDSSDAAASGDRLTINVERAAARVKLTNDIPAAMPLSNITLVGATTTHPLIHQMSWMVTNYNEGGFTVANGSTDTGSPTKTFVAKDFTYFHQHSLQSKDVVYIGENYNATKTQVIVEVQLKDGSFLLGDCFSFEWEPQRLYTSVEALIDYYKSEWNYTFGLDSKTADEVFCNTKVTVDDNGNVTVKLTNSTFTADDQMKLNNLAATLSGMTTCHRDGKMYYTYTLDDIIRNNAYNLSLVEEGETDTRHVVATFKFDQGTSGQTATFSNGTGSFFTSSVALGSNLNYYGKNDNFGQTLINPTAEHNSSAANETDYIDFQIDPEDGWTFTPSRVSFNTTRFGTDGGQIDAYWLNSNGSTTELATGIIPYRNSHTPSVLSWSNAVTAGSTGDGVCGLRLKLHSLKENKQVGFSDIVIQGTLTKTVSLSEKKSISIVGRAAP